ncbi:hypothetical protein P7C70_g6919, partial [Phenoliferia sp. Uapishka_3]
MPRDLNSISLAHHLHRLDEHDRLRREMDRDLAYQLQSLELNHRDQIFEDRTYPLSNESAFSTNWELLRQLEEVEEMARKDRQAALELADEGYISQGYREASSSAGSAVPRPSAMHGARDGGKGKGKSNATKGNSVAFDLPTTPRRPPSPSYPSFYGKPYTPYDHDQVYSTPNTSSSTWNPSTSAPSTSRATPPHQTSKLVECVSCNDELPSLKSIQTPCGHHYCISCLRNRFLIATKPANESLMPPSCDQQPIPLSLIRPYLSDDELTLFEDKRAEYATKDRVYCHQSRCSKFLGEATKEMGWVRCVWRLDLPTLQECLAWQ